MKNIHFTDHSHPLEANRYSMFVKQFIDSLYTWITHTLVIFVTKMNSEQLIVVASRLFENGLLLTIQTAYYVFRVSIFVCQI